MVRTVRPERAWWHVPCNRIVASEDVPTSCPCGAEDPAFDDFGWRVGFNGPTYAYYSTYETAMKDRRVT